MSLNHLGIQSPRGRRESHLIICMPWRVNSNQLFATPSSGSRLNSMMTISMPKPL
ncbi:Aspartate--tRNA(Asp/Asn) ligase [Bienertia sinuspersici]